MMTNLSLYPVLPQIELYALFDLFCDLYSAAQAKLGSSIYSYSIADFTVSLVFASPAPVPLLTPALVPLASSNEAAPHLTFYLQDDASTPVEPSQSWTQADIDLHREVPTFSNEQLLTAIQPDISAVSVLNRSRAVGFYWIDSSCSLRTYERAAPLKVLLHWWLRERSLAMIHAGAVGTEAGSVLFVSGTGAGKFTTTLAYLNAGLH